MIFYVLSIKQNNKIVLLVGWKICLIRSTVLSEAAVFPVRMSANCQLQFEGLYVCHARDGLYSSVKRTASSIERLSQWSECTRLHPSKLNRYTFITTSDQRTTLLPSQAKPTQFINKDNAFFFYTKTNQMHNISNLFYFGTTLYMFRTVFPSIIRSLRLYIQHQIYVTQVLWLLA